MERVSGLELAMVEVVEVVEDPVDVESGEV